MHGREVHFFTTCTNKGSGVSSLICHCVNTRFQGYLPLPCKWGKQLPCSARDKVSFGEKCGFLRPALSWCRRECLITSNCDSLRGDLVLACRGGGSMSWLVWESEPGCGAIACPTLFSSWLPSHGGRRSWAAIPAAGHTSRERGCPPAFPHRQEAHILKLLASSSLCQFWRAARSCLCGGCMSLCFHIDSSGCIFTCLVLGDLPAKEDALCLWVVLLCAC